MNPPSCRRAPRAGFTLVELLVVIVIMGILVALLVPAILSAVRTANDAAVASEITLLANALSAFKDKHGDFPPSRVLLVEDGSTLTPQILATQIDPAGTDLTVGGLRDRTLRHMRKMWPRAITQWQDANGDGDADPGEFPDYNGNNRLDGYYMLEGHECLVFFLGGVPSSSGAAMSGFAKNPVNPFVSDDPAVGTSNRFPPFFEFRSDRLFLDPRHNSNADPLFNNGIPGYIDSLVRENPATGDGRFYAYFMTYGPNGYDPNDVNFPYDAVAAQTSVSRVFQVTFVARDSGGNNTRLVRSEAPNPYTTSAAVPLQGATSYVNANSYQIVSAGRDRSFGFGGRYDPSGNADRLPLDDGDLDTASTHPVSPLNPGARNSERDNITNFASGRLE